MMMKTFKIGDLVRLVDRSDPQLDDGLKDKDIPPLGVYLVKETGITGSAYWTHNPQPTIYLDVDDPRYSRYYYRSERFELVEASLSDCVGFSLLDLEKAESLIEALEEASR